MKKFAVAAAIATIVSAAPVLADEKAKTTADPFVSTQGGLGLGAAGAGVAAVAAVGLAVIVTTTDDS